MDYLKKHLKSKRNIAACVAALVHWVVTFFTDHLCFEALPGEGVAADFAALPSDGRLHFVLCKLILLALLIFIWGFIFDIIKGICSGGFREWFEDKSGREEAGCINKAVIFKYMLIYFLPIIAVLIFKLPEGFLSNDESLIFAEASALHTYTWFYYLTTYYYIVCMMLIPSWLGPVLVKVFLQLYVCGYTVYRLRSHTRDCRGYAAYFPFFIMPVLAYTTSAHRIPVYYLLYYLLFFRFFMDRLEKREIRLPSYILMCLCGAALTQWRTEGIYMLGLFPVLMFICYREKWADKKRALLAIIIFFVIEYLMTVPQNGLLAKRLSDQADNRMGPFWAYTVTNMYRNGLDMDENRESLEMIWRYLNRDTLEAINRDLGDINYEDTLILYYPGYTGRIETAGDEDYIAYVAGCKRLFTENIPVFIKTRIGAFKYAALPYHISLEGLSIGAVCRFFFSIFKCLSYNLFLPCIFVLVICGRAFIKRDWLVFFMGGGLICHWLIVFVLAPASYFKYYFPIYMCGWSVVLIYVGMKVIGLAASRLGKGQRAS